MDKMERMTQTVTEDAVAYLDTLDDEARALYE